MIRAAPYSPCLATTTDGPRVPAGASSGGVQERTSRAAATRFGLSVSWRSSASLRITQSTLVIAFISDSRAISIHRFIESSATKRAWGSWERTSSCSSGWMLARNRTSLERERSESLGAKPSNTPSWVSWVSREFRSQPYSPCQKKVRPPGTCSMSETSTPRPRRTSSCASPKSSPTGPTTRTSSKKDAASEKCTAAPPSIRSRSPKGVLTVS